MTRNWLNTVFSLDSFEGRVPAQVLGQFMSLGGVRPVRGNNGTTKYVFGSFETLAEAQNALSELIDNGFNKAQLVGDFNGKIIEESEATKIKND